MTRAELLQEHVASVDGLSVTWGVDDCTAWAAAWVLKACGLEVPFSANYGSRDEALTIIDGSGGLEGLWSVALAKVGIYSTPYPPELGDVAVVGTSRYGAVGTIFAHDGIALWRSDAGVGILRPRRRDILRAWSLPER